MSEASLQKSVEWEVGQYLPDEGTDYYISYEIQEKINEKDKKAFKVMVAAAHKTKIRQYVELTNVLGLKLRAIDFSSNCVARVFKDYFNANSTVKNIGIINIGINTSVITFLEEGKFAMQRQISFGINNLTRIVLQYMPIDARETSVSYKNVIREIDLNLSDELNVRAQNIFTNAFGNMAKVIQFYTSGRAQKNLDEICFIGEGTEVRGLSQLMESYFGVPIKKIERVNDLNLKIRVSSGVDLKTYINNIGLLMRKE
jgi:type IV pilus assembly protein PilM